jgi:hypothetical protein
MSLKQDLHDRLWRAFQRWEDLRQTGVTKHELKMQGIRECGDPNRHTRNLIFAGNTLRSYEGVLRAFVEHAEREHGAQRLEDVDKKALRSFMDKAIAQGLAVKTLNRYRSALAKFGALTGQTAAFVGICARYADKIRELAKAGQLPGPTRATPSREVVERAIQVLKDRDARHFARTGDVRTYHLAARLQLETATRSISATSRVTADSLRDGNRIVLIGKGGKVMEFILSPELHGTLRLCLARRPGPLAGQPGYRAAYARAVQAAGGRVTATHGIRRRSIRDHYSNQYARAVSAGLSPEIASAQAAGDAIERLGHSRHRRDHGRWYLGR